MATNMQKWSAEFLGTFWLTFGGCGSAVLAAAFPQVGIGLLGVSFAFGLTVLTGAYAFGPVSGGHFNPAVSVGLAVAGRFKASELPGYIIAQVVGAIAAAAVLYLIASGKAGANVTDLATNGYGEHSPGKFSLVAALVTEVVLTAVFLLVILGSTAKKAAAGFAGMSIGLCLTLIHLISIRCPLPRGKLHWAGQPRLTPPQARWKSPFLPAGRPGASCASKAKACPLPRLATCTWSYN